MMDYVLTVLAFHQIICVQGLRNGWVVHFDILPRLCSESMRRRARFASNSEHSDVHLTAYLQHYGRQLKCRQISQNMHTSRDLIICKLKIRRDWYTHYFSEKAWCMQAANYGKHMLRLWYSFISLSNSYMIRCQDLNTVESWSSHHCYCYSILMIRSKIKQKTLTGLTYIWLIYTQYIIT